MTFTEAIAREEGWLDAASRCRRNHNPGDIEYGDFARDHGATGGDPRFAIFPDDAAGFSAASALLREHYLGLTVTQAIAHWAPPNENNTVQYILNVCKWCGCDSEAVLTAEMF